MRKHCAVRTAAELPRCSWEGVLDAVSNVAARGRNVDRDGR
jgi:hypothetical protein